MSELKVNKISPRSGTAFTLGDSGDTFTVPSGAGLTLTDSTLLLPTTIQTDKLDPKSGTALEIGTSGDTITIPTGAGLTVTDEVKTNKISPATGTAFTLGDSGDTFTIPSGATLTNNGTATGFGGATLTAKQATTSGSSVDFTGIPAGTKWITVQFNSMGSNGTDYFGVQLGDSGGIETSGYLGNLSGINSGTSGQRYVYASEFVIINPAISAEAYAGIVHLRLFESSSYTWAMSSIMADDGGGQTNFFGAGQKSLSAELTQVRVMTSNTFDEGNVSIQYGQ